MELLKAINKSRLLEKIITILSNILFRIFRGLSVKFTRFPDRVLIISLHKIGDSIFTFPAIASLIEFYKKEVYLLSFISTKIIYSNILPDNFIITVEENDLKFGNRVATSKARKIIKKINPSVVVDLTGSITSASLIFNCHASKIYGMNEKYFKNIYTRFIDIRRSPHLIQRYTEVAYLVTNKKSCISNFPNLVEKVKTDSILIHPYAGWKAKEWGVRKFIALSEMISAKFNAKLIFKKGEMPEDIKESIIFDNINFIETNSLNELVTEIKKCTLFVGNDSGPLYLAAYFGKPTFTIYGPTNPDYSKPLGKYHSHVRKELRCSPYQEQYCFLSAGRDCPNNICMQLLEVNTVSNEISNFIEKLKTNQTIMESS
jgi:ADP-heptose:LPS heptosyltransferase